MANFYAAGETPLFDEFGMPTGEIGASLYAELLREVRERCYAGGQQVRTELYEVIRPRDTRLSLVRRGLDFEDFNHGNQSGPLVGVSVRRSERPLDGGLDAVWGWLPGPHVGALIGAFPAADVVSEPSPSQPLLVIVSRSGFRGVLRRGTGGSDALHVGSPGEPRPRDFPAAGLLLESALGIPAHDIPASDVISVRQFMAVEVVRRVTAVLELGRTDPALSASDLVTLAFASALVETLRVSLAFTGRPGEGAGRVLTMALERVQANVTDLRSCLDVLPQAFAECGEVASRSWSTALEGSSTRSALAKVLPHSVLADPAWGGPCLVGFLLRRSKVPSLALRGFMELPLAEQEAIATVLDEASLDLRGM